MRSPAASSSERSRTLAAAAIGLSRCSHTRKRSGCTNSRSMRSRSHSRTTRRAVSFCSHWEMPARGQARAARPSARSWKPPKSRVAWDCESTSPEPQSATADGFSGPVPVVTTGSCRCSRRQSTRSAMPTPTSVPCSLRGSQALFGTSLRVSGATHCRERRSSLLDGPATRPRSPTLWARAVTRSPHLIPPTSCSLSGANCAPRPGRSAIGSASRPATRCARWRS